MVGRNGFAPRFAGVARKTVTHDSFSFHNPKNLCMLESDRIGYIEAT